MIPYMRHQRHAPPRVVVALHFLNPCANNLQGVVHPNWIAKGRDWITADRVARAMRNLERRGHLERVSLQELMGDDPMSVRADGGRPPEVAFRMTQEGSKAFQRMTEDWKALPDEP